MNLLQTASLSSNHWKTGMGLLLATHLLFAGGCAAISEEQTEARERIRTDFKEKFIAYKRQCFARGGQVFIDAKDTLARDGTPHKGDHYFCS